MVVSVAVSVALAVGRKERLRFAVEKLSELGCSHFWPLDSEYMQFPGNLGSQVKKLQATAVAALKQSRRPYMTEVELPLTLTALLKTCVERKLEPVFCQPCGPESVSLDSWAAGVHSKEEFVLVVGPEGGFSEREADAIAEAGHQG